MKKTRITVIAAALSLVGLLSTALYAGSETPFPADWKSYTNVSTPLTAIGALPACGADVSSLPPIYRETVSTYCNVRKDGPGKVAVLVKPASVATFKSRSGKFADGTQMILHLKDMKVLMVSGYRSGKALYGVFTEDGKDITAASGPLSAGVCRTCHTGYSAFCVNGQCSKSK